MPGRYLAALQTLGIAAKWIQESMDDLQRMVDNIMKESPCFSLNTSQIKSFPLSQSQKAQDADIEGFKKNWESVLSYQQHHGNALLARIETMEKELDMLKDFVRTPLSLFPLIIILT